MKYIVYLVYCIFVLLISESKVLFVASAGCELGQRCEILRCRVYSEFITCGAVTCSVTRATLDKGTYVIGGQYIDGNNKPAFELHKEIVHNATFGNGYWDSSHPNPESKCARFYHIDTWPGLGGSNPAITVENWSCFVNLMQVFSPHFEVRLNACCGCSQCKHKNDLLFSEKFVVDKLLLDFF